MYESEVFSITGHDLRLEVIRSLKNPARWDSEELKGNVHYCPVDGFWFNQMYTSKHTPTPLCPMKHRLIIRAALSDTTDD